MEKDKGIPEMLKYLIISIAVFLALIPLSLFIFPLPNPSQSLVFAEAPLSKNTPVQFTPGERYSYSFSLKNQTNHTVEVRYIVKKSSKGMCIVVEMPTNETACFDSYANELDGTNLSFKNSSIVFFQPWMLALKPGWRWSANLTTKYSNSEPIYSYSFRVIGEEKVRGRDAYRVESVISNPSGNVTSILWIDKEKRVLLRQFNSFMKIELFSAPFTLERISE